MNFPTICARRVLAGCLVLALSTGYRQRANATPTPGPVEPPSRDVPAALAGLGAFLGAGVVGGLLVIPPAFGRSEPLGRAGVLAGVGLLMLAPAIAGHVVCGIENRNERYQSSCMQPVLGAYAGIVVATGVLSLTGGDDDSALLYPGLAAALVLPAIGAVMGWHVGKRPRAEGSSVAIGLPNRRLVFGPETGHERASLLVARKPALPLLAGSF